MAIYKYREANEEDLLGMYEIERISIDDPWSFELMEKDLTTNEYSKYFVVTDEKENILGFCATMFIIDEVHITNIAISPEYRGLGLGKGILEYSIAQYVKMYIKGITLEVNVNNSVAIGLYEGLGFEIVGKRPRYYKNNEDAYIMWKYLGATRC